jgi:hypothetical protein
MLETISTLNKLAEDVHITEVGPIALFGMLMLSIVYSQV